MGLESWAFPSNLRICKARKYDFVKDMTFFCHEFVGFLWMVLSFECNFVLHFQQ